MQDTSVNTNVQRSPSNGQAGDSTQPTAAADTTLENVANGEVVSTVDKAGAPGTPARAIASYKPFPLKSLPEVVREYVSEAAAAIGCDSAFIALPVLASLARAIGNRRVISMKSSWPEPAIIWGAIVGKSGTRKTPAIQTGTKFMQEQETMAIADYQKALAEYADKQSAEGPGKDAEPHEKPSCLRYVTTDVTIEALFERLASQFDGLLVIRDELASWIEGIAEYKGGQGSDKGHWLASWSGVSVTVDRKSGPQKIFRVPRAAVSIVGGIQPGVLKRAIGREHLVDGLCARLLLAMPEPRPVVWSEATISPETETAMASLIEKLIALEPAKDDSGRLTPKAMPMSPGAKAVWVKYYDRHGAELAELDDDLAAAWSKLEAYTARFALIFQLCSSAAGDQQARADVIGEAAMISAIKLSDWFGGEAKRVYALFAESDADRRDRELFDQIRRRGGTVTTRQLMRSGRHYSSATDADAALSVLARRGWGRWEPVPPGPTGGPPTRVFRLADTVDADTTHENIGNGEVVSASAVPEVRDKPPQEGGRPADDTDVADAVDADTTTKNASNEDELSAPTVSDISDEPLEDIGHADVIENADAKTPAITAEPAWGEV